MNMWIATDCRKSCMCEYVNRMEEKTSILCTTCPIQSKLYFNFETCQFNLWHIILLCYCIVYFWHCSVRANHQTYRNALAMTIKCILQADALLTLLLKRKRFSWFRFIIFFFFCWISLYSCCLMNVFIWNNKICCYYNRSRPKN